MSKIESSERVEPEFCFVRGCISSSWPSWIDLAVWKDSAPVLMLVAADGEYLCIAGDCLRALGALSSWTEDSLSASASILDRKSSNSFIISSNFPLARPLDLSDELLESTDGRCGGLSKVSSGLKFPELGRLGDLAGIVKLSSVYCSMSGALTALLLRGFDGCEAGTVRATLMLSLSLSSITGDVSLR
ncbi:hypothetical protein OGAPHI_006744 [Ogataea philodendri]|uniref:Uncharacterized protein n=1 Tax=Ogataea philodendri TaxID=1378263 RepID=A0A9P8NXF6_9ASCO|nr:uncharacterized protein OGAPHI_006744 [Ogataea philodendri]KAH3661337.1 hypothetical protein OGAPHI_006744 [Ogataea philodendri]